MAQKSTLMIVLSSFLLPTCFLDFFGLPSVATNDGTPVGPLFFFFFNEGIQGFCFDQFSGSTPELDIKKKISSETCFRKSDTTGKIQSQYNGRSNNHYHTTGMAHRKLSWRWVKFQGESTNPPKWDKKFLQWLFMDLMYLLFLFQGLLKSK